jgi:hypothetical protein
MTQWRREPFFACRVAKHALSFAGLFFRALVHYLLGRGPPNRPAATVWTGATVARAKAELAA